MHTGRGKKMLKISVIVLTAIAVLLAVSAFAVSVMVYQSVFKVRFEPDADEIFTAEDFDGLQAQRVLFQTKQGHTLVGYKYRMEQVEAPRGVMVFAHGFGGGSHCIYMPLIAYMAEHGYAVFSYDITGNHESEGKYIGGFPQGIIDLDYALRYVKKDADYQGLPVFLMGHSWGGYSVGNVLNFHTDIQGAVLFAGIDSSAALLRQEGRNKAGKYGDLLIPFVRVYEWAKYGKYALTTASEGIEAAKDAQVLVVHSKDDKTVLQENGYDLFYKDHSGKERVHFVLYGSRGHSQLFYPVETIKNRRHYEAAYSRYLSENKLSDSNEIHAAFRKEFIDYTVYYKLDDELMGQIADMFDAKAEAARQ